MKSRWWMVSAVVSLLLAGMAAGTQTEHQGFVVRPAPGPVRIDGQVDDWDLTGSVFVCDDVEVYADQYAMWFSAMWDEENLYVLARWVDRTPMNNPGSTAGDMGFKGDSLQFRTICGTGGGEKVTHWTCWRGSDGKDLVQLSYGRDFKGGDVRDAAEKGAKQAFAVWGDKRGYTQEIAMPWSMITADGKPPRKGEFFVTVEANFSAPVGRLTIKDLFKPGVQPDRIFTFRAYDNWSPATLMDGGKQALRPVRLSDGREFAVKMVEGLPVVDWTGLNGVVASDGFVPIRYEMPEKGFVSLIISDQTGKVVRQLKAMEAVEKGEQTAMWDGLTTGMVKQAGDVLGAGEYQWQAIGGPGVHLVLKGWACAGGNLPWEGSDGLGGWGGDHGEPAGAASDEKGVYLGWAGAESGRALVAVGYDGKTKWRQTHGGMGGAGSVAVLDGVVYVVDHGKTLYRVSAETGAYSAWEASDVADIDVSKLVKAEVAGAADAKGDARKKTDAEVDAAGDGETNASAAGKAKGDASGKAEGSGKADVSKKAEAEEEGDEVTAIAAAGGRVYLAYRKAGVIVVLDAKTGRKMGAVAVDEPVDVKAGAGKVYAIAGGKRVVMISGEGEQTKLEEVIGGLSEARAIAIGADGRLFVALGGERQQIAVFDAGGKAERVIGRVGGRATVGRWTADGVADVNAMTVDAKGRLWVMEAGDTPKRVSLWNTGDGSLINEFFGATHYGASGGAIDPLDESIMVGEGCEWRIDQKTGRAKITGVIEPRIAGVVRFVVSPAGGLYLVSFTHRKIDGTGANFRVYQRMGEGEYQLLAHYDSAKKMLWSDDNRDGVVQRDEVQKAPGYLTFNGYYCWSHGMADDMSLLGLMDDRYAIRLPSEGFNKLGVPQWRLADVQRLALPEECGFPYPSNDGKLALVMGGKALGERWVCVDLDSGKVLWTYPNQFMGVHGSHRAPPAEPGMMRGAFGVNGTGRLPEPIGRFWVINTNKGEWHILSEHGFYVTRLFEGDLMKVKWPAKAEPGTLLDDVPPGSGEEDFGGSVTQMADGRLFLQTGKSSLWAVQLTGQEKIRAIGRGAVTLSEKDVARAFEVRSKQMQRVDAEKKWAVHRGSPEFTGKIGKDFSDKALVRFGQGDAVTAAMAWDDANLYVGFEVKDGSPWENGADAPIYLYSRGDTVDLQLGTNAAADAHRMKAAEGDVRVSIGSYQGAEKVVIYREVSGEKKPRTFSSGVVKSFVVDNVTVLDDAKVKVTRSGNGYTVEAAIPLSVLRFTPSDGLVLRGDMGVTFGNATGKRTGLRTYWSNRETGLVSDEVYELKIDPSKWGEFDFQQ